MTTSCRRTPAARKTARDWSARSSPVVEILDDPHPIGALRRFLDSIKGAGDRAAGADRARRRAADAAADRARVARRRRGQGARRSRARALGRLSASAGVGFHAQEFLRNAFAAVGVDRDADRAARGRRAARRDRRAAVRRRVRARRRARQGRDAARRRGRARRRRDARAVPPRSRLRAVRGRSRSRRAPRARRRPGDPGRRRAVSCRPCAARSTRSSASLKELGEPVELRPPVRLDAILDAERAAQDLAAERLPRAARDHERHARCWDREFLATGDYREPTALAQRAHRYRPRRVRDRRALRLRAARELGQPERLAALRSARPRPRRRRPATSSMLDTDEITARRSRRRARSGSKRSRATILGTN